MKHISRELHDNVAQMLTLVKIQLSSVQRELPEHAKINSSKEYISTAIEELRALSKTLNNDSVLQEGLGKAIEFELKRIEKIGIFQFVYEQHYEQKNLDRKQEIVVFRIFQELIQNTIKHAQAKKVRILLQEDEKMLNLAIEDDGVGFDFKTINQQKNIGKGSGLANIQYRVSLLKGTFEVGTSSLGGSLSMLKIPYNLNP